MRPRWKSASVSVFHAGSRPAWCEASPRVSGSTISSRTTSGCSARRASTCVPRWEKKVANRFVRVSSGRAAHAAVSCRPSTPLSGMVARTEGYMYDANVSDLSFKVSFKGRLLSDPSANP
jgi:hypothetical protein